MCGDCSVLPPEETVRETGGTEELGGTMLVLAAVVGGIAGGILGGVACIALSVAMGPWAIGVGILPGIGARLGVRTGSKGASGRFWTLLSAATTVPGFAMLIWMSILIGLNSSRVASGYAVDPIGILDPRVGQAFLHMCRSGEGMPIAVGLAFAMIAATLPVGRR